MPPTYLPCHDYGLEGLTSLQHVTSPPDSQKNFLVVDSKTETSSIEQAFESFTSERKDIGIVLINQHVSPLPLFQHLGARTGRRDSVTCDGPRKPHGLIGARRANLQIADRIRPRVENYQNPFPALLEIPSKDHPYDPEKDSVLRRVRRLFGD